MKLPKTSIYFHQETLQGISHNLQSLVGTQT